MVEHKLGQRHVQGRTKAGGQSQQRFARRRDNQARQAYEAAADHAARILGDVRTIVTGGDHAAVDAVLDDLRLPEGVVVAPWLAVPDPRRAVLDFCESTYSTAADLAGWDRDALERRAIRPVAAAGEARV